MKEEASIRIKKRTGALAVAAMMAVTVFSPVSVFGDSAAVSYTHLTLPTILRV